MKKHLKSVISLLLAFVLFATALPLSEISASAAEKLSSSVTYKKDGTAVVELKAGDFYNSVRYTTDGSVPTKKSKLYLKPIEITEETLIRAAEFDDDKKVKGIKLTVDPENAEKKADDTPASSTTTATTPSAPAASAEKTGKVTFEVTQLGDYKAVVEIECETPDCEIRYTTDGSKPDENSELYKNGIIVTEKTKIRARAYKEGYKTTTTYSKTVPVKLLADVEENKITENENITNTDSTQKTSQDKENDKSQNTNDTKTKDVTFEPADDEEKKSKEKIDYKFTYMAEQGCTYVTFLKSRTSNTIFYTTDGTVPTKKSKKYTKRVKFTEPGVIRAKEYTKAGECVATISLNVKIKCAPVEFVCVDLGAGTRTIELRTDTENATIYYTTDGSNPDPKYADIYKYPLVLGDAATISAMAVKEGYKDSNFGSETVIAIPFVMEDFDFNDPIYMQTANVFSQYRASKGVTSYIQLDEKLTEAANIRAKEISVYMEHTRPNGKSYSSVCKETGTDVSIVTEFIASYFTKPEEFLNSLVSSSENENHILGKGYNYDKMGVGYYDAGRNRYWVILLATTGF